MAGDAHYGGVVVVCRFHPKESTQCRLLAFSDEQFAVGRVGLPHAGLRTYCSAMLSSGYERAGLDQE